MTTLYFTSIDAPYRVYARMGVRLEWLIGAVFRLIDGHPIVHVSVGDEQHVWDCGPRGMHRWDREAYERRYPGIRAVVRLDSGPIRPTRSCIGAAVRAARAAGADIPRGFWTPARLYAHLAAGRGDAVAPRAVPERTAQDAGVGVPTPGSCGRGTRRPSRGLDRSSAGRSVRYGAEDEGRGQRGGC